MQLLTYQNMQITKDPRILRRNKRRLAHLNHFLRTATTRAGNISGVVAPLQQQPETSGALCNA